MLNNEMKLNRSAKKLVKRLALLKPRIDSVQISGTTFKSCHFKILVKEKLIILSGSFTDLPNNISSILINLVDDVDFYKRVVIVLKDNLVQLDNAITLAELSAIDNKEY